MSSEYEYKVQLEVPGHVEEETVLLTLEEMLKDLIDTDRFEKARVISQHTTTMNDDEQQRLEEMLSKLSDEEVAKAIEVAESLQENE